MQLFRLRNNMVSTSATHDDKIENQTNSHTPDQHRATYIPKQKYHISYPAKTQDIKANNNEHYAHNDYV